MRFLEQEVSEGEYSVIDTIMRQHLGSAPASAFPEVTRVDCERIVSLGLLHTKVFGSIGLHYLASPPLIGAYIRERGLHQSSRNNA